MKRLVLILSLVLTAMLAAAPAVAAGEWSPGRNDYNGAADHGASECLFNGRDDPDPEDDGLWAMTPAGGLVQSGGQITAGQVLNFGSPSGPFTEPGIQGIACNPTHG